MSKNTSPSFQIEKKIYNGMITFKKFVLSLWLEESISSGVMKKWIQFFISSCFIIMNKFMYDFKILKQFIFNAHTYVIESKWQNTWWNMYKRIEDSVGFYAVSIFYQKWKKRTLFKKKENLSLSCKIKQQKLMVGTNSHRF